MQIFMQNGVPCHRSTANVTTLVWPGNCPGLYPMENQWEIMNEKVADKHPSSASALVDAMKNVLVKLISVKY